jgi:hypothetical protein
MVIKSTFEIVLLNYDTLLSGKINTPQTAPVVQPGHAPGVADPWGVRVVSDKTDACLAVVTVAFVVMFLLCSLLLIF